MSKANRMNKNDEAVSPIVATLVLIVVAIIGAAAVGLLLGTFSNDVSKQANAGNSASQASTSLLLAGSTSLQPVMQKLGTNYTNAHSGVKVVVSGGGSGYGAIAAGTKVADIGMMSEPLTSAQSTAYPALVDNLVAYGGIAVIENFNGVAYTGGQYFSKADLLAIYTHTAINGTTFTPVYRSDSSGTQDIFLAAIGMTSGQITTLKSAAWAVGATGSSGVLGEIKTPTTALAEVGFLDVDYLVQNNIGAATATSYGYATVSGFPSDAIVAASAPSITNVINAVHNQDGKQYPLELTRGWYLVTNGPANGVEGDFINYVRDPINEATMKGLGVCAYDQIPASLQPAA